LVGDDSTNGDGTATSVFGEISQPTKIKISAMIMHHREEVVLCGKEDGTVSVYDSKTGAPL
jgi:hypothetical protein